MEQVFSVIYGLSNENLHIEGVSLSKHVHFSEMDATFLCQHDKRRQQFHFTLFAPVSFHHFEFDKRYNCLLLSTS